MDRWATDLEKVTNYPNSREPGHPAVAMEKQKMTLCKVDGCTKEAKKGAIIDRMVRGMTLEDALSKPKGNRGPKAKVKDMTDFRKSA